VPDAADADTGRLRVGPGRIDLPSAPILASLACLGCLGLVLVCFVSLALMIHGLFHGVTSMWQTAVLFLLCAGFVTSLLLGPREWLKQLTLALGGHEAVVRVNGTVQVRIHLPFLFHWTHETLPFERIETAEACYGQGGPGPYAWHVALWSPSDGRTHENGRPLRDLWIVGNALRPGEAEWIAAEIRAWVA
jgi:hypothetical protein